MGGTDAKDILGLPKTPLSLTQEKKSRPHKESHRKPDGISREVSEFSINRLIFSFSSRAFDKALIFPFSFLKICRFMHLPAALHLLCLQLMLPS